MSDEGSGQNYRAIGVLQRLRGDQCCEAGAGVKKCWMIFSSIIQSSNIDWMLICKKIPKNKWNFLERKVEPVGHRCAENIFFNGWKPTFNKGWRRKNNRSRSKTDRLCNTGGDCVSFTTGQLIDLKSTDLTVLVLNPSVGDFIQRGSQKLFQKLSSGHARFTYASTI